MFLFLREIIIIDELKKKLLLFTNVEIRQELDKSIETMIYDLEVFIKFVINQCEIKYF